MFKKCAGARADAIIGVRVHAPHNPPNLCNVRAGKKRRTLKANVSQENRVLCHVLRQFSIV